ncbi:alginate export family protein [Novosphingobium sp. EMRT-2]|uniref:alginate export family protein n=1 Tax=Novosphingobium sp. EMRT-2 TaxID=2571749 RepID=UPI002104B205|nr:alginate export family protein [Novosphingobium sp. EMRT-2]
MTAAAAAPARATEADDGLRVTGNVRLRVESIDGQARTGFDRSDTLVNLRTQVLAQYRSGPFRVVAEVHDSRVWNADPGTPVTTSEVNTLEPVQAFLGYDLGPMLGSGTKVSVQGGRFTVALGSRRLIAADEYRNTVNSNTGLRMDIAGRRGLQATLIYVLPAMRLPDDAASLRSGKVELDRESFDAVLWGGIVSRTVSRAGAGVPVTAELGFFHFGERDAPGRPTRDRSLSTATVRVIADPRPGHADGEAEAMVQWGHTRTSLAAAAPELPVRATFFHADAGYTFGGPWRPRLSIEFDYASGAGSGSRFGRFDTLFGMRRGDLAPSGIYNAVTRANIMTPGIRLETAPDRRMDLLATYHPMWLADSRDSFATTGVRDASGRSGSFAGHQFDLRLRYWLLPRRLRLELGGVLLAKGRFLTDAPNAPPGRTTRYGSFNLSALF